MSGDRPFSWWARSIGQSYHPFIRPSRALYPAGSHWVGRPKAAPNAANRLPVTPTVPWDGQLLREYYVKTRFARNYVQEWCSLTAAQNEEDDLEDEIVEELTNGTLDDQLSALNALHRIACSAKLEGPQLEVVGELDRVSSGKLTRLWLEREACGIAGSDYNDLTVTLADLILDTAVESHFLNPGRSEALEQTQDFARKSKEILVNPSAPVGRIDGGHHLYAPRRPRLTELLQEYACTRIVQQAFGRKAVAALVGLTGQSSSPVGQVGAMMCLRECLPRRGEAAQQLAWAAVDAGLVRNLIPLLTDDKPIRVEWPTVAWKMPLNRPASLLLFSLLYTIPEAAMREQAVLLQQGVPCLLRLAQYDRTSPYRTMWETQHTRIAAVNVLRMFGAAPDPTCFADRLVELGGGPILLEQSKEFEPLPDPNLPGCEPYGGLAVLSFMAEYNAQAQAGLVKEVPALCALLGAGQSGVLQERVLDLLRALCVGQREYVWECLMRAHGEGSFQHQPEVDPVTWQHWWSNVVERLE